MNWEKIIGIGLLTLMSIIIVYAPSNIFTTGGLSINTTETTEELMLNGSAQIIPGYFTVLDEEVDGSNGFDALNYAFDMDYDGKYLYIAAADGLSIIDTTIPRDLNQIASYNSNTAPFAISVNGPYAYVCDYTNDEFEIYDVGNPSSITRVGNLSGANLSLDGCAELVYDKGYVFALGQNDNAVSIIDVSNASDPREIANITDSIDTTCLGTPIDIVVWNQYILVGGAEGLMIADVTNPHDPLPIACVTDLGPQLAVSTNTLFVANATTNTLYAYNLTRIGNIQQIDSLTDGSGANCLSGVSDIKVSGNYLFALGNGENAIALIDVSDPSNMNEITCAYDSGVGGIITNFNSPQTLVFDGKTVYVGTKNDASLVALGIGGLHVPSANIGSLSGGTINTQEFVTETLDAQTVSARQVLSQGAVNVVGNIQAKRPTMYLTSTTRTGAHNCDDNPIGCCAAGYHICTIPEFISGGRQIETNGTDRVYSWHLNDGDVYAGSSQESCSGYTSTSGTRFLCLMNTTVITGDYRNVCYTASTCSSSNNQWCCSS